MSVDSIFNATHPVVMAHPAVLEAKRFKGKNGKEQGDPKFGASFVYDPEDADFKAIKAKALALAKAKWPDRDIAGEYKAGKFKMPWTSGDKLADKRVAKLKADGKDVDDKGEFQRGKFLLKAASKFQPRLAIVSGGKIIDLEGPMLTTNKGKFFFGAEVLPQLNFVAYDAVKEGDPDGITAYLNLVLATGKGTRLSGGASAAEVFKGYAGQVSAEDPTATTEEVDDL